MLGVSRQRCHEVTIRRDFPAPIDDGEDHDRPIWAKADVDQWIARRQEAAAAS